ncbi:hypothetical protein EMCRGX_G007010 [Ephydatia muelleri]
MVEDAEDKLHTMVEDCAIPLFGKPGKYELPQFIKPGLAAVVNEYQDLFITLPGTTLVASHQINTSGSPVRIPARRIPAPFRDEVEEQLQQMLQKGIIVESSSPWLAPAVYVRKNSGEIRICVDYREQNKLTIKDAYPLPMMEEVQDRLAGAAIFSKLDLQSGYWQLPVDVKDREKTAFSPGPGMGSFEFTRMLFGQCGAPSSFQRLMDKITRGLPFVTTYIDDVLIHSANEEEHKQHLSAIFSRLKTAGLTLRGRKCQIGMPQATYLGHVFCAVGVTPDETKVKAVMKWPTPSSATEVRQFLGLASYYRKFICHFSDIAAHLHKLTQKVNPFCWTADCEAAFRTLKSILTSAPVLTYPRFDKRASHFVLQTDASAVGLGAILQQDGYVIGYVSRVLSKSEANYSVIQRECLALVYGMKQFRHYLLGHPFQLWTDHEPLQWLSGQKMEGLLCRWALALQEYDFRIVYRKASLNTHADALSRRKGPELIATTRIDAGLSKTLANGSRGYLEVPVSPNNSRYLLVIQDYFTKWAEARPLPDQTAARITHELMEVFANYAFPDIVHSDQGRNFESTVFHQTLEAFGVHKSRTTAYHPQGDGLVERFNRTLLQLLRTYVEKKEEWEKYIPLAIFAYRTTIHHSTGVSQFEMMFGRKPCKDALPSLTGYETLELKCQKNLTPCLDALQNLTYLL